MEQKMKDETLWRVKDLMNRYSVSDSTVRRWIRSGLPSIRIGQQILRFEPEEVTKWMAKNHR